MLEFGGGFERKKLKAYLSRLGAAAPRISVREIEPGRNQPANQPGTLSPDVEVYMDLEILASVAPDAALVVYFAENSNRGWVEALHAAIFDTPRLSVLSISWGQAEALGRANRRRHRRGVSDGRAPRHHGLLCVGRQGRVRSCPHAGPPCRSRRPARTFSPAVGRGSMC